MLHSLEIRNYRNLRHLTIEKLGRVNLLVGKNNTGKTSVLEAVYLWANNGRFDVIYEILESRDGFFESMSDDRYIRGQAVLSSLFTDRLSDKKEGQIEINSQLESDSVELRIRLGQVKIKNPGLEKLPENSQPEVLRLSVSTSTDPIDRIILAEQFLRLKEPDFPNYGFSKDSANKFVKTSSENSISNGSLFDDIVTTDWEVEVVDALKIVDARISKLAFRTDKVTGKRYPVVRLDESNNPLPLRSMGDGINRILTIILAMVNCENGYLLIDEFENGLHYSVQEKIWEIIFYLAEKLNIQVFATTHSLDCVEAFSAVLNNGRQDSSAGAMIRLENYEGNIEATVYDADEIQSTTRVHVDPR
ncbi:AAA family ATPase [Spirosoma spitsbergense]|uniref:AAA family ATPase n=1 Tax=Spirosoma spitsbergense TaxID=431554 RepID=UPI00036955C1|nr:ATP-binding protein [Spirosoma spitsbergense]